MLPENWDTLRAFLAAQTQWRTGRSGIAGLDYTAARHAARAVRADGCGRRRRGRRLRWRDVAAGLREMEAAALDVICRGATAGGGPAQSSATEAER